jgi:hypothetical protein
MSLLIHHEAEASKDFLPCLFSPLNEAAQLCPYGRATICMMRHFVGNCWLAINAQKLVRKVIKL